MGETGAVGTPFSFTITASGAPTSYAASPLPAGVSIVAVTGAITGTPPAVGTTAVLLGATNTAGTGNATLTITVAAVGVTPPSVTTQPVGQTATASQSAIFTVGAGGNPAPTYQWQRLPAGSTSWENLQNGSSYSGVTTATLTVSSITAAMSGDQFRVVITSSGNSTTSGAGALTVTGIQDALFQYPAGITRDSSGNLYVADSSRNTILKITPAGVVSTLAGLAGVAGTQDGSLSTARFDQPAGVTVDAAGNLVVADTGNATIRRISPTGIVTTFAGAPTNRGNLDGIGTAASFGLPNSVAVDPPGNVYVADTYNNTIRKILPSGLVTTLAGSAGISGANDGTGFGALFNQPFGVTVDAAGNIYVADTGNDTIRLVTPAGVVTTIAGVAGVAGLGDGAASNALFNEPRGLVLDGSGNLYIADSGNAVIRWFALNDGVRTMALTAAPAATPAGGGTTPAASSGTGSSSSGGGGAMESWFVALLALIGAARLWPRLTTRTAPRG